MRSSNFRLPVLLALFFAPSNQVLAQIDLGTASSFGILAASKIANTGNTIINGKIGIFPGTDISGFPPGVSTGIEATNAAANQAQQDAETASNFAALLASDGSTGPDLGGQTLAAGVYTALSSVGLTGTLTLDAQGDPNAQFVFQIGSTLTTGTDSFVILVGGARPCNIFWQVGSSATLGTRTTSVGNVVASDSITLMDSVSVQDGLYALNAAVTLINDRVSALGTCERIDEGSSSSSMASTMEERSTSTIASTSEQVSTTAAQSESETSTSTPISESDTPTSAPVSESDTPTSTPLSESSTPTTTAMSESDVSTTTALSESETTLDITTESTIESQSNMETGTPTSMTTKTSTASSTTKSSSRYSGSTFSTKRSKSRFTTRKSTSRSSSELSRSTFASQQQSTLTISSISTTWATSSSSTISSISSILANSTIQSASSQTASAFGFANSTIHSFSNQTTPSSTSTFANTTTAQISIHANVLLTPLSNTPSPTPAILNALFRPFLSPTTTTSIQSDVTTIAGIPCTTLTYYDLTCSCTTSTIVPLSFPALVHLLSVPTPVPNAIPNPTINAPANSTPTPTPFSLTTISGRPHTLTTFYHPRCSCITSSLHPIPTVSADARIDTTIDGVPCLTRKYYEASCQCIQTSTIPVSVASAGVELPAVHFGTIGNDGMGGGASMGEGEREGMGECERQMGEANDLVSCIEMCMRPYIPEKKCSAVPRYRG